MIKILLLSAAFKSSLLNRQALEGYNACIREASNAESCFSVLLIGQVRTSSFCWTTTKITKYLLLVKSKNYFLSKSVWGVLRAYYMGVYRVSNLHVFFFNTYNHSMSFIISILNENLHFIKGNHFDKKTSWIKRFLKHILLSMTYNDF